MRSHKTTYAYAFVSLAVVSKSSRIVVNAEVILTSNVCSSFDLSSWRFDLRSFLSADNVPLAALCMYHDGSESVVEKRLWFYRSEVGRSWFPVRFGAFSARAGQPGEAPYF